MTNREFLNAIAYNTTLSTELREFAAKSLNQLDNEQERRRTKASLARASENAGLLNTIAELISEKEMTASEIAKAMSISTQKATALAKSIPDVIVGETKNGSRLVKTYFLKA